MCSSTVNFKLRWCSSREAVVAKIQLLELVEEKREGTLGVVPSLLPLIMLQDDVFVRTRNQN